jgi:hypothetical protein
MTKRWSLTALGLVASLALPAVVHADPQISLRFFDSNHGRRDYHNWNENEDRQYRQYLTQRRRPYVAFQDQRERQQQQYWQYRHKNGGEFRDGNFAR